MQPSQVMQFLAGPCCLAGSAALHESERARGNSAGRNPYARGEPAPPGV
jgi:hypothetical protein